MKREKNGCTTGKLKYLVKYRVQMKRSNGNEKIMVLLTHSILATIFLNSTI